MSWRGTLILAVVVAILAFVVLRDTTPSGDPGAALSLLRAPPTAVTTPGRLLLDIDRSQVEAIVLASGTLRFEARRRHGQWQDPASAPVFDALLDDLSGLRTLDEIAEPESDLAEYGLQPPRGTLELNLGAGSGAVVLHIGDHNPSTTGVYVRFGDSGPVYVAGALVEWKFRTALKQLGAR